MTDDPDAAREVMTRASADAGPTGDKLTDEDLDLVRGAGYLGPVSQDIIAPHDGR